MCRSCLATIFLLIYLPAWGATYYVAATGGNDSNTGTATTQAWKTISKVNSGSFSPGDSILFKRGEVWRESLTVPSSGSAGNVITFSAYGSGNKPSINGSDLASSGWTTYSSTTWQKSVTTEPKLVWFNNILGTKVGSIGEVNGANKWYWASNVIYVYSTSDPATAFTNPGIEVASRLWNLFVVDIDNFTVDGLDFTKANYKQFGYSIDVTNGSDNVTITNSDIHHNGSVGINVVSGDPGTSVTNTTISHNKIYNNGLASVFAGSGAGVIACSTSDGHRAINTIIEYNDIHDNGSVDWGDHNVYDMGDNTIIRYNKIYNAKGIGIKIANHNVSSGTQVYYNLIYGNQTAGIKLSDEQGAPINNRIYNNTLVNNNVLSPNAQFWYVYLSGTPSGNEFKNNILIENNGNTGYGIYYGQDGFATPTIGAAALGLTSDKNLIYITQWSPGGDSRIASRHGLADYATLSAYQAAMTSSDQHSISSDPLFVSTVTPDFQLQPSSPAIDAGANVGLTTDYAGNPISGLPDIGAYEHTSLPTAPANLSATSVSPSQITLSWTDQSSNETGFLIERKTGTGGTYSQIATAAANATAYGDNGLAEGTTYFYRVRAVNRDGNSAYSNEASATTPASLSPKKPSPPSGIKLSP